MTDSQHSSGAAWRFPIGSTIAAVGFLVGGIAALLLYAGLTGMSHGNSYLWIDIVALVGIALIAGASYLFAEIGRECGRDSAPRLGVLRAIGVIAYVLALACGGLAVWAVAMAVLY